MQEGKRVYKIAFRLELMRGDTFFSIVLVSVVILFGFGVFLLLHAVPLLQRQEAQAAFVNNLSAGLPAHAGQFYANMRFVSPTIVYSFGEACTLSKKRTVFEAFRLLESKTPLRFTTEGTPVFFISCQDVAVPATEADHFVAGEGGPSKTINATQFYIIQMANVSLYRDETCDTPHVALHEILHALGFDHTSDSKSIMYPVTDCAQQLDTAITDELTRLYTLPSYADAVLTDANVSIADGYMSFIVTIANQGLTDVLNATLVVEGGGRREFTLGEIGVGKRKLFSVENIRVSNVDSVHFTVVVAQQELSLVNNEAILTTREPLNSRTS